jgi:hypothetical protein
VALTFKRIISIAVLSFIPLLAGCSQLGWKISVVSVATEDSAPSSIPEQERRFAGALEFLRTGNEVAARDLLEQVVEDPSRAGVTDEALFRLSIMSLRDENGKGSVRSLELLERLKSEFPQSIWTHQAAALGIYLSSAKTIRDRQREIKTLKELNLSLSRDNREMRQSIERLKSLDLELEKKIKR